MMTLTQIVKEKTMDLGLLKKKMMEITMVKVMGTEKRICFEIWILILREKTMDLGLLKKKMMEITMVKVMDLMILRTMGLSMTRGLD